MTNGETIQAVILRVRPDDAVVRLLGTDETVMLKAEGITDYVPGQTLTLRPRSHWKSHDTPRMSIEILDARIDIPALGLLAHRVEQVGTWEPSECEPYPVELRDVWTRIVAAGERPAFEVERIVPGMADERTDPIRVCAQLGGPDEQAGFVLWLEELLEADLQCLDAHMLLGSWVQDSSPDRALLHYEVGVAIVDHLLGHDFRGALPTYQALPDDDLHHLLGNFTLLRLFAGYAALLWRLGRLEEADTALSRWLFLSPDDVASQRWVLRDLRAGRTWDDEHPWRQRTAGGR